MEIEPPDGAAVETEAPDGPMVQHDPPDGGAMRGVAAPGTDALRETTGVIAPLMGATTQADPPPPPVNTGMDAEPATATQLAGGAHGVIEPPTPGVTLPTGPIRTLAPEGAATDTATHPPGGAYGVTDGGGAPLTPGVALPNDPVRTGPPEDAAASTTICAARCDGDPSGLWEACAAEEFSGMRAFVCCGTHTSWGAGPATC